MDAAPLRAEIKAWERDFKADNGRDPTIQDIKDRPDIGAVLTRQLVPWKPLTSNVFFSREVQAVQEAEQGQDTAVDTTQTAVETIDLQIPGCQD